MSKYLGRNHAAFVPITMLQICVIPTSAFSGEQKQAERICSAFSISRDARGKCAALKFPLPLGPKHNPW